MLARGRRLLLSSLPSPGAASSRSSSLQPLLLSRPVTSASSRALSTVSMPPSAYETLAVEKRPEAHIAVVKLNRPSKRNAMNSKFWRECRAAFDRLGEDGEVRAVVLCGEGKVFSSGLDLTDIGIDLTLGGDEEGTDPARKAFRLKKHVAVMQEALNAIERVPQPVICAIHGACIGGAIDMVAAADIRLASAETVFSIKEVDIGLAADLGTLARVPRVTGNGSLLRELCFTGRNFTAAEAQVLGLLSRVLPSPGETLAAAEALAKEIAAKSPVAVYGTKVHLNYSRDHSVADALDYITTWNAAALQTKDIEASVTAALTKGKPTFSKL